MSRIHMALTIWIPAESWDVSLTLRIQVTTALCTAYLRALDGTKTTPTCDSRRLVFAKLD